MARGYELMVIVNPDTPEEDVQELIEKTQKVIEQSKGEFLKVRKWGRRKLVYKIKGFAKGTFLLFYFNGGTEALKQLDLLLRYSEQVLRYQTVALGEHFDIGSVPEDAPAQVEEEAEERLSGKSGSEKGSPEADTEEKSEEAPAL